MSLKISKKRSKKELLEILKRKKRGLKASIKAFKVFAMEVAQNEGKNSCYRSIKAKQKSLKRELKKVSIKIKEIRDEI